ncbi:MAG: DnaJ domain-containing protein [Campylobacterota bacterium]|nr:DnaJ domain-containing protein [Campylobacterota bacterium]
MEKKIDYEEFTRALEILDILTLTSYADLKERYLKLSKKYHPDMPEGDAEKFKEINESYKIIQKYMQDFRFQLNEEEFDRQNPFSKKSGDLFYNF